MSGRGPHRAAITARLLAVFLALGAGTAPGQEGRAVDPITVYVGTYTRGTSRGIYRFTLDPTSGRTTAPVLAAESEDPSFLALSTDGDHLYAVNETDDFDAEGSGAVSAFLIDRPGGALRFLGARSSRGAHPCHLAVDGDGRHVLVANYSGGNVAVLAVGEDGRLLSVSSVRTHTGPLRGGRQDAAHAHAVVFDPTGRFVLAADLGLDRVFVYRLDRDRGALAANDPEAVALPPGSGPRHLAFHPSGRVVYVIGELDSTITVLAWDGGAGRLEPAQTVSTLPSGFEGQNSTAEIAVSSDGRFVYGSNRGHDSIAVFRVDPGSGRLTAVGHVPTGGKTPRHFAIDATGRWLLAANEAAGGVVVFRIDEATGLPSPVGPPVDVDRPVCVLPVSAPR